MTSSPTWRPELTPEDQTDIVKRVLENNWHLDPDLLAFTIVDALNAAKG